MINFPVQYVKYTKYFNQHSYHRHDIRKKNIVGLVIHSYHRQCRALWLLWVVILSYHRQCRALWLLCVVIHSYHRQCPLWLLWVVIHSYHRQCRALWLLWVVIHSYHRQSGQRICDSIWCYWIIPLLVTRQCRALWLLWEVVWQPITGSVVFFDCSEWKKWTWRNLLMNDAINKFYIYCIYGIRHIYKYIYHSDIYRWSPLPPHRLLFPISSKGSFMCTIP